MLHLLAVAALLLASAARADCGVSHPDAACAGGGERAAAIERAQAGRDAVFPEGTIYYGGRVLSQRSEESDDRLARDGCDNALTALAFPTAPDTARLRISTRCDRAVVAVVEGDNERAMRWCQEGDRERSRLPRARPPYDARRAVVVRRDQPIDLDLANPPILVHACFLGAPGCESRDAVAASFSVGRFESLPC